MNKIFYSIVMSILVISCSSDKKNTVEYSGEDISQVSSILRDKNTKKASLKIEQEGKWVLYVGNSVETVDFSSPILEGENAGSYPIPVNDSIRSYFLLKTNKGTAILAERHLPMTGGYNFRDMGGIKNKDGKYVKWGKVLRSDDLNKLTDADLVYLNHIPLRSVVDFRSATEIEEAPDKVPASATEYRLSISPGSLSKSTLKDIVSMPTEKTIKMMEEMNRSFSTDSIIINEYITYFQLLQDDTKTPLLFHCTAGKDRTGMGAALFLYSLGVDGETIFNDYLSSNTYLGDKYAQYTMQYPSLKPLLEVQKEYLKAGIDEIKRNHGPVEQYLENVLNVDIGKMKEIYLYK